MNHRLELRRSGARTSFLQEPERDAQNDHARHDAPSAWIAGGEGDRRQYRQQNDQRVSNDDQQTEEPAALPLLRNFIRPCNARSRLRLALCEACGSRVQGSKQVVPVFPRGIEDGRGDANVMLLCLCGDLRFVWGRKGSR